jgi:hypothetical protein
MRALLDVNVWVALFDDDHVFSERANAYVATAGVRIATCPLIENGVVRILNLPSYGRRGAALGLRAVRDRLREACAALDHAFWADDVSLRDADRFDLDRLHGHNQVTDAYLLALAVAHGGCLATFDQNVALSAVRGATPSHLLLL